MIYCYEGGVQEMPMRVPRTGRRMTDEQCKRLALDLHAGRVFTDRDCRNPQDVTMVFMPLLFMSREDANNMVEDEIALVYEYMSEAGPRACNGMPMFMSCRMLNRKDFEVVREYHGKLIEAVKAL